MGDEKPSVSQSTAKLALWLSFAAFVIVIVVFHSKLKEITFGDRGMSAKMMDTQEVNNPSATDRQNGQQGLQQGVRQLEKQKSQGEPSLYAQHNDATNETSQADVPNIGGTWGGLDSSRLVIAQSGINVALTAYLPNGLIAFTGSGQLKGMHLDIQTISQSNRAGLLSLDLSPNQQHLNGHYTDVLTKQVGPLYLHR
jgi:hypothetical protein